MSITKQQVVNALVHHPFIYFVAVIVGAIFTWNAYSAEVQSWVGHQIAHGVYVHVASNDHHEYDLRALESEERQLVAEKRAVKREKRDYESRIFTREGAEQTEKLRNEIRYYEGLIEDLDEETEELDRLLKDVRDDIKDTQAHIDNRVVPQLPTANLPVPNITAGG